MIDLTHWVPRRSVDDGDRPKLRPFAIVDRHGGAITQHGETTADALIRFLSEGITVDLDAVRHLAVRHDESIRLWRRSRPRSDFFLTVPAGVGSIDEPEWWCADMDDRQLDRFQDTLLAKGFADAVDEYLSDWNRIRYPEPPDWKDAVEALDDDPVDAVEAF